MRIVETTRIIPIMFLLTLGLIVGNPAKGDALSQEIAPDVPSAIMERLLSGAKVYIKGNGSKEILLLADPYCENSRKTYRQLLSLRERLRTLKILWVSAFPQKGSEIPAAAAMRMQALEKGSAALETVFGLAIPPSAEPEQARQNALAVVNETFGTNLGKMDLQSLKPELDQMQRNTDLAREIGYTGTPHFIVDGRVLHGHSGPAIRILLKQGS